MQYKQIPKTKKNLDELLMRAVLESNSLVTIKSIKNGANPNLKDAEGNTLLMLAASNSNANILRILLRAGAQTDAINPQNMTALDWSKRMKRHLNSEILESVTKKIAASA